MNWLRRLFARPDPLESEEAFRQALADEARREQAINASLERVYRANPTFERRPLPSQTRFARRLRTLK